MQRFFVADGIVLPAVIAVSLVFAFITTPYVRAIAKKCGIIDIPRDARRMHKRAVPLAGGGAMILAFVLSITIFSMMNRGRVDVKVSLIMFGAFLCGACGLIDDIFTLKPMSKMAFQLVVSLFAAAFIGKIESFTVFGRAFSLGFLSVPATVFWIMLIMNAVNLMDGMDGLASGVCASVAFALSVVLFLRGEFALSVCACAASGACLGFLCHNAAPASIFMGEVGSAFLGFTLAVLTLPCYSTHDPDAASTALLLFLLPVTEAVSSFLRRVLCGKNPFSPDKKHIHHLLYENGFNAPQICLILYVFASLSALCAVIHTEYSVISVLILSLLMVFIRSMLTHKHKKSRKKENRYEKT